MSSTLPLDIAPPLATSSIALVMELFRPNQGSADPPPDPQGSLRALLRHHFGFDSFRPFQEEIIQDSLAGRDVFALLPTGGGKSLCYQLPALARPGLTVVISPLIALMKDQVDGLLAAGVPATFLNSSLEPEQAQARLRGLRQGEYRLLYMAPERILLSGFLEALLEWNIHLLAVDEAHCISEWGHDFRPEYRQLAQLRERLPKVPMMALTATATERVRADIVRQLQLRDPRCYTASFNRPNLTYRVEPKQGAYARLRAFIQERPQDSGIVYCQARRTAEDLATRLRGDGLSARPYHAGLQAGERSRHQDQFLRDEVQVICATIAFGMGIHKPNVRFIVHYDLPKNVEGYYQETGRAGRDGLPGECLLLFSPGDVIKYLRFIDEKTDPQEKQIARTQLDQMIHYAEGSNCRRAELLAYFGETWAQIPCGACDNCLNPRDTFDGTVLAQKFLSCLYRIREKSGFSVGLNHVVEVLTGADTEKVRKWNHDTLSTFNIGSDVSRAEWMAVGRELIRLGLVRQDADHFRVLETTAEGWDFLKARRTIALTRQLKPKAPSKPRPGTVSCDEDLFERLRTLRRTLAQERGVPPYIIFSDVALRQMARDLPRTDSAFLDISGVGEHKLQAFGARFLEEIAAYLSERSQAHGAFLPPDLPRPEPSAEADLRFPRIGSGPGNPDEAGRRPGGGGDFPTVPGAG